MTRFFIFSIALIIAFSTSGQQLDLTPDRFAFEPELNYNSDIQSPADFLGYELGDRFTEYEKSVQYFHYLAEVSDRISINQYGETYEGRPLLNLAVSDPNNLARIDEIQGSHQELLTAHQLSEQELNDRIADEPVFTSFSYNIHGNEASSTEAAMQVAYRMAAAQDRETAEVLRKSVVIMFICINPDGRDRYIYWINGVGRRIPGVNPRDLEHYAPWPNGRTNHYWFDLNRDWVWGVHPESRGHTGEYQKWMPQVHVDYHEQGYNSNYFTAPGTTPRNLLLPDSYEAWSDTFGRANVEQFDRYGLMYFTRDRFDFFYPGYGSSYPSVMGAIGMLTEQGGIGAGRAIETNDGYTLLLRQRIFDHYTTSWATIKKSADQREALLKYSIAAWDPATSKEQAKTYIIKAEQGGYVTDLLRVLERNKIKVERARANFKVSNVLNYRSGQREAASFTAGDYIIRTNQPRHLFIHSILGRNMAIEDSVMYDMATWSAPLAYNLEAYSANQAVNVATAPVGEADWTEPEGLSAVSGPAYAYVIDWQQRWAPRALSMLWAKSYRVRSALEGFSDGEQSFNAGSLIILRGRNLEREANMAADMQAIANEAGVEIHAMASGRMLDGYDLASSRNQPVKQPKAAMLVERPFNTYTAGQVYFLFDQETDFPLDRIRTSVFSPTAMPRFGSRYGYADLSDYDVLILPGGGNGLKQLFTDKERELIMAWLQQGGTLIALESAAEFFTATNKYSRVQLRTTPRDTSAEAKTVAYAERERYRGLKRIPGSALNASIDTTHPLAFGLKPELFNLKFGSTALIPDAGLQSVGRYHDDAGELLTAGYASEENLEQLAGHSFAGVTNVGQGKIVFLLDNQHYRMFWRGGSRMLQNAVMLLPGF